MSRVPADSATAFAHRSSKIMATVRGVRRRRRRHLEPRRRGSRTFVAEIRQGDPGAYVNFVADEGEGRIHEAYPGTTWDRLAAIKGTYDPDNLFRLNQNVPPAG